MSKHITDASLDEKRLLLANLLKQEGKQRHYFPASFAQERMWFLTQLEPDSPFYNIPAAVRLSGPLQLKVLEQSLNEIIRRHEALRTNFTMVNGKLVQVIAQSLKISLTVVDVRDQPEAAREAAIEAFARQEAVYPFNLASDMLMRISLGRLADEEHVLLLTMHHIISDAWSIGVFLRELGLLYESLSAGRPVTLPELTIQYTDFAHWQRQYLQGNTYDRQLAYWKERLADAPPVLDLPTDRPRPPVQSFRGAAMSFTLLLNLSGALRELSLKQDATLFMTLLAAFKVLLWRYSGQDDLVIGTPVANRNRKAIEPLIGFFVNSLALRTKLSARLSFNQLLEQVREVAVGGYAHQDFPFEELVEQLQPHRDLRWNPIFQVMFSLQNAPMPALELAGLKLESVPIESETAKFDLILSLAESAQGLGGAIEFNTDLFDRQTIDRLIGHYQHLLEAIAANPQQLIADLPLLTDAERQQILYAWNDTARDYPQHCSVHELFEAQAERTPTALAVVYPNQAITYGELNQRANQLAHYLRRSEVGPDVPVILFVERSVEMVVAQLGILKAGGCYVPLDPSYPKERLEFMIENAGAGVLLTQQDLMPLLPAHDLVVCCLDRDWQEIAQGATDNPVSVVGPDNLAYIIYTSGSTGKPKGISIPHQAINRLVMNTDYIALGPGDCVAQAANASFDAATFEIWGALLNGAQVVGVPTDVALSPSQFAAYIRQQRITTLFLTTALFNQLAQEVPEAFSSLTHLLFGGEAVDVRRVERVLVHGKPERLLHVYGPTESTTFASWHLVGEVAEEAITIPIGRPIANTRLYVLDGWLQAAPVGVPGELYIGGDGLARDYWQRPELTAEKFIPDPLSGVAGARLYKTGDVVRYRDGGAIEFIGRVDHQVKLRGFRIEMGEIEAALQEHAGVREAVVVAREDQGSDKRLVGYITAEAGAAVAAGELQRFLRQRLPAYMVPAAFVQLEQLPLTPNGKVDRRALPAPEPAKLELAESYVAPQTVEQKVIAGILAELLAVERVGLYDNFFDLGGHSLLATQAVSRLREAFKVEVPLRRFFEAPTVAGLVEYISRATQTEPGLEAPPITIAPRDQQLLLSYSQQRLWMINQLVPDTPAYNMPFAVRLEGELNEAALRRSLQEIVRRHEALRTRFRAEGDGVVQVIAEAGELELEVEEVEGESEGERQEWVRRRAEERGREVMDLEAGPLMRVSLLRKSEKEHVLVVVMHHIVSDGWSMGVLVKEMGALYEAYSQGQESPLSELEIQYADFAQWQRGWLKGEVLDEQVGYWKEQLGGLAGLEMPTDRPRPALQTFAGDHQTIQLTAELTEKLRELSQAEGATMFMTLLAGFKVLLWRYSGQSDVAVGTPIANRNRQEIEPLIGFFVNTLVLRTDMRGAGSFREVLRRVKEVALGAYAHQDMPFEKLVEELQPERDLSRNPLFQVVFALQNTPQPDLELAGLNLSLLPLDQKTTLFDLTLSLWDGEAVSGFLSYNTALFDSDTMTRLVERFEMLLSYIAADPDQRLGDLSLLSAVEQEELLVAWESNRQDFPADRCIHKWFEAQAERTPYAVAVNNDGEELNYEELNSRANQLAHYLQSLGVGPETAVAICTVRSLDLIVGILGILKAGGAYVPLEPAFPRERLLFMLEDTQAPVLLTHQELTEHIPELECKIVCLDTDWFEIAGYSDQNPDSEVQADNLAYIIYTSGSTGRPKGVQLQHRGLVNLVTWHCRTYEVTEADRATLLAGLSFDASVWELWPYLIAGASLYIAEEETRATPAKLIRWFADEGITLTFLPTPLAEAVLEEPLPAGLALRAMLTGGDKLRRAPNSPLPYDLVNHYGPAENTVVSTWSLVASGGDQPPAIGKAIDNTAVYVLNADLQPVPCDIPGELYIGSVGLARGYHGHADLSAERFIPNPFSGEAGARLYRSGDLVRRRVDGELEFLGRVDNQVKIRGFRIELGEIEAVLCEHADVREAIVLAREDRPGEKRLVAYVVPVQPPGPAANDLRNFLREKLPAFMVPSYYVMLEGWPITPNGKIDYRGLPAPDRSRSDLQSTYVAPRTPLEQTIATMWADLLGVEQVGIHDNFFELGGHSLLATQVVSRVRDTFQIELPLRNLFESPTIAELASVIESLRGVDQKLLAPPITPVARDINLPLSFAQQRLWFIDQFESGSPAYNMHFAIRYVGDLQVAALERSLNEVIRRHEVLRTTFAMIDGQPFQQSLPEFHLSLTCIDLRAAPTDTKMNDVQRLAGEELLKPFDLARDLMMRATLYRVEDEEYVLLLIIHHIASDGWSMSILTQELTQLYSAFASGQPSPLAPLPIQYADYAYWQRQWLQGEVLQAQLNYWREQLANAPPVLELPTDRPRPAIQTFRGAKHVLVIPAALTEKARALSQREGTTLFMTLLAAFKALLSRYTGQPDVVVGTPIAGRTRGETEPLIGFFINTLVMRTDLTSDPTVQECLSRVRATSLDAYAHQDLPFEKLVEELQPQRDVRYTPLFQVMFALQNAPLPDLELPNLSLSPIQIESGKSLFDITLSLLEGAEGIVGSFEYNTDLFKAETIARLGEQYQRILEAMTDDPQQRLSALPLLSETEAQQILWQWNDTRSDYEADQCIQTLFEAQVARTPEAVAVIFDNEKLTYSELNRLANQLAHHLKARGARPEQPIGILVERSKEMIIGMLGILKAGGVYLPMDPAYPKERLAFMLNDAHASLLLTQQRLLTTLPEHEAQVICLDSDWPVIDSESADNPNNRVTADHLAYVMYTSGSTGWPKGVSITHRNVARLVRHTDYVRLAADEVILQFAPISFDASTFEIWGSLLNGAQLAIMPPHLPSLEEFGRALRQYRVSTLWLTAGLFHLMVDERLDDLQSVRQLLAGGDVLSVTHVRSALQRLQGTRLINGYGPTESTTFACCYHIASLDPDLTGVPIGRPIANTQAFILDEHLQPVPVGVRGELYISGDGLARGYWNQPELTAATFRPHPFAANPGERLYKTGDLARYRADGNIEFLGRADNQVKLRGFRIEPGEIETVLSEHRAVREAVVLVRTDQPGDKRLVAYITSDQDPAPTAAELRGYLEGKLPEFMIPSLFVSLDNLSLTANGKVDRAALAETTQTPVATTELLLAPRNELEEELTRIWEEVLGIHPVGVRDNFFEIGGHSLLAVRLISRIEQRFGKKLPLASLFQSPTVEHLAQLLQQQVERPAESPLILIQPGSSRRPLYLVHAAAGTVFCYAELARQLGADQPVYGLQAPALDGQCGEFSDIEAMAAHYNEAIRASQPEGPYRIGGWSMGGLVAYEMARQLEAQGHTVELLALFDSAPISKEEPPPAVDDLFVLMNFAHDLGLPVEQVARWVESLGHMETEDRLGYILEQAQRANIVPADLDLTHLRRFLDIFKTNVRAMHQYAPKPYAGRIVLFKAAEMVGPPQRRESRMAKLARRLPLIGARRKAAETQDDPSLGWASLTSGEVAIQTVPGTHYTMMREPHIAALGQALGTHLNGQ